MSRKTYFRFFLTVSLFLAGSTALFAQSAPVRGEVKLQKADGTTEPAVGATVEAFRTDIERGKMPDAKTNKSGGFNFVGIQYGQTYAIVVSGPGITPQIYPNVKAGMENISITVTPGDGKKWTEAEIRAALAQAGPAQGEMTEAQKKERAEIEKKNAEITARNTKLQENDEVARKMFTEGNNALKAKNWPAALTSFDAGIAAVPDYVGSTPVLLNGKMLALKNIGYEAYKAGAAMTDVSQKVAKYGEAKQNYNDALAAYDQAIAIINKAPAAADANETKNRNSVKMELMLGAMEIHRLMAVGQVDTSRGKDALAVFNDYFAVETDAAKKSAAQLTIADILREDGDCDAAVNEYKKTLAATPDNPDALAGAGLCLFSEGYGKNDKAQMQEGLNYMQRFTEVAPENHKLKESVKASVDLLKNEQKLTPQKTSTKRKN